MRGGVNEELILLQNYKNMKLKNRFFKSGSWEGLTTEDSHMTDEYVGSIENRSRIIIEIYMKKQ